MKVIFDLPRGWEVRSCEINGETQIVIEPLFRNRRPANVLFATVIGDSGRETHTILSANGATGALTAVRVKEAGIAVAFDKPEEPEEQKAKPEVPPSLEGSG